MPSRYHGQTLWMISLINSIRILNIFLLLNLCDLCYGGSVGFPMYPYCLIYPDGKTLGMGAVSLFMSGPITAYHNPANLDSFLILSISATYERKTGGFFVGEGKDVGNYPQSFGVTIPILKKVSLGFIYQELMKWRSEYNKDTDKINGALNLSNVTLGCRLAISEKLNLGFFSGYAWGRSTFDGVMNNIKFHDEYNTGGGCFGFSNLLSLNKSLIFALRFLSATPLRGKRIRQGPIYDTLPIVDNIPWEVNGGVEYIAKWPLTAVLQITYRNWQRYGGLHSWGNHEFRFHGGFEFHPHRSLNLRIGTFLEQFSDNPNVFLSTQKTKIIFFTGGVGIRTEIVDADIGVGRTASIAYFPHCELPFYPNRTIIIFSIQFIPRI